MLLELMLAKEHIAPSAIDGFEAAAERFGLDFIQLIRERYFFALSASAMKDPLIQQVIGILQCAALRSIVNQLACYDDSGSILPLSLAFKGLR